MMSRSLCVLAVVVLPLGPGVGEAAPPQGKPLLIHLPPEALPLDVSASGFVLVGGFFSGGGMNWMPTSGAQRIGAIQAIAVSRDGKTIVGEALDSRGLENAAIWSGGTSWRTLGSFTPSAQPCDLNLSSALGTSADGRVIVGLGWNGCGLAHAFRWEESTGMVDLGSLTGQSTRANGISGDGRVVIGWEESNGPRLGAKWVERTQQMIQGPFGPVGEAYAANRDGSIIVGGRCNFNDPRATAWKWTAAGVQCFTVERPRDLPNLPYGALMLGTSDDGRVIGGAFSFGLDSESLVWFDGEVLFLKDYLRQNGIPDAFDGWINTGFVQSVTPDGRILVGYGAGPTTFQGFMVILPELD